MGIYIVSQFGTDWSIFADASLTVRYIKTMFGSNWSTFAVARV